MYDMELNLSPRAILEKEFKVDAKGYRPKEVDEYLDMVIKDYTVLLRSIKELTNENKILSDENNALKAENRKLSSYLETIKETSNNKFSYNNVDILKRLSNLEKIVYSKDE